MAESTKATPPAAASPAPAMRRNDISMTDMSDLDTGDNLYHVRKSRLIRLINWWQVASTYLPHLLLLALGVLVAQMFGEAWNNQDKLREALQSTLQTTSRDLVFDLGWKSTALFVVFVWWMSRSSSPLYMVDFSTFEPPEEWKVTHEQLAEIMRRQGCFTPESVSFMEKILSKSGTGQATAWPPGIIKCLENPDTPADRSVEAARTEAEIVIFDVVGSVLEKVGLTGRDIDFLIINCSLFSPTPSLCSMVSHKFGMRSDARTFNLSGMGCSAGVISLDLAKDLLKARPNSVALVVSTENLTQNLYHGNERSMLLQNTLFRVGGAAILLSNKWQDASRSKFKLLYTVRTQGAGKDAFEAVYESEDSLGNHGVRLSKEIVKVAGRAMEKNFTSLGPYVLPISEQYKVVKALALRKVTKCIREMLEKRKSPLAKKVPIIAYYQPDFKRGIDHFCIHAGGRGVIDGIEKNLALQEHHTEPSRATLRDYGNTSSSSIWYEMKYIEEHSDLRRGQRILQVAFGSGFKCNSAVWICLNPPDQRTDTVIVAIDVVIVVGTTICTLASLGYIAAMARMRRNFFIVLRSPFLACMFGLCSALRYCSLTYEYALAWGDDSTDPEHWIACLIAYPAQLTAEIALVLIAFRLLVMFYPAKRAKYGRYIKEKPLTRGLACAYALMEVAVWVSAAAEGIPRTAQVVSLVRPLSAVINIVAAVSLGGRLREVDDLSNMSRDVCVVGLLLLLKQSLQAGFLLVPMSPLVLKYYNIAFVALSYVPIVWIINIRPVREVLRHIPERRRSTVEILLLSPHRKVSASNGGRRVVATADVADSPARQDREAYVDSNRLTSIMTFLPLRAAFGEYCQKALCGESFEFLLGVYEFKDLLDDVGEESGKGFGGFGGHLAIVNDYIKDGSHSEVNIASRTKRNIMRYNKFKDYALLSLEERKGIYTDAEHEVSKMLGDNLLNKFLASDTYKKVVDFEGLSQQ